MWPFTQIGHLAKLKNNERLTSGSIDPAQRNLLRLEHLCLEAENVAKKSNPDTLECEKYIYSIQAELHNLNNLFRQCSNTTILALESIKKESMSVEQVMTEEARLLEEIRKLELLGSRTSATLKKRHDLNMTLRKIQGLKSMYETASNSRNALMREMGKLEDLEKMYDRLHKAFQELNKKIGRVARDIKKESDDMKKGYEELERFVPAL